MSRAKRWPLASSIADDASGVPRNVLSITTAWLYDSTRSAVGAPSVTTVPRREARTACQTDGGAPLIRERGMLQRHHGGRIRGEGQTFVNSR